MVVRNKDQRPQDYRQMEVAFAPPTPMPPIRRSTGSRPAAEAVEPPPVNDRQGAAGAVARQLLLKAHGTEVGMGEAFMTWRPRLTSAR